MRHLRALVFKKNIDPTIPKYLPKVQSTGSTPADIIFENSVSLDRGIFLPENALPLSRENMPLSIWQANHLRDQQKVIAKARTLQRGKDIEHIASYPKLSPTDFKVGSYVLVEYPGDIIRRGPDNKLLTMLKGPFKIVKREGDTITVLNSNTKKDEKCHVMQLRPFFLDARYEDPEEIVMRDFVSLFKTEAIMEHRGDIRRKAELYFRVRWLGYGEELPNRYLGTMEITHP